VSRSYKTTLKGLRLFQIQNRMEKVVLSTELVENQSQLDPRRDIVLVLKHSSVSSVTNPFKYY